MYGSEHIGGGEPNEERSNIGEIRQQHPKAYDRWTPADDTDLLARYRAGQDIDELAVVFRRQPSAIESRLKKLALDLLRPQPTGSPDGAAT